MTVHAVALLLSFLAELTTGSLLVCKEAHTLPQDERIAVAASVRTRMIETGKSALHEMRRPAAYVRQLCPPSILELSHLKAYLAGRYGYGPAWTREVHSFYHRRRHEALASTWRARGLTELKVRPRVVYWTD